MIGSQELAEALTDLLDAKERPELAGFDFLADGSYRDAYLGPDGYVYKIESWDSDANETEYLNYQRLLEIGVPEGWGFAPCDLIDHVLVMEYVPGDEPYTHWPEDECDCTGACIIDEFHELTDHTGIWDMHSGNFRIRDGIKVLIDYAA